MSDEVINTGGADIADFDTTAASEEGVAMEVRHPKTGEVLRHAPKEGELEGRPFTITYRGKDSPVFRDLARKQQDRRIQANIRTRSPILSAVVEKDDIDLIVAATIKWDIVLNGKIPPNDPKEYRAAYTKYPWLKEQGDEFIGVRANFIKG